MGRAAGAVVELPYTGNAAKLLTDTLAATGRNYLALFNAITTSSPSREEGRNLSLTIRRMALRDVTLLANTSRTISAVGVRHEGEPTEPPVEVTEAMSALMDSYLALAEADLPPAAASESRSAEEVEQKRLRG